MSLSGVECKNFIEVFKAVNETPSRLYIVPDNRIKETYSGNRVKNHSFKTKQIRDVSQKCLNYFASDVSKESLQDRVYYLGALNEALTHCAARIEDSIKRRWWYCILHFFGYQAKCPKDIQNLIHQVKAKHLTLEAEWQELKLVEVKKPAQEVVANDVVEQENEDLLEKEHLKQEQKEVRKIEQVQVDLIEDEPADIKRELNEIKTLFEELKALYQASYHFKTSYEGGGRVIVYHGPSEIDKESASYKSYQSKLPTYQACISSVIQHPNLTILLANHAEFQKEFFVHLGFESIILKGHEVNICPPIDWNSLNAAVWKNVVHLFFEYASNEQLAIFLQHAACKVTCDFDAHLRPQKYRLEYPGLTQAFFDALTLDRLDRFMDMPQVQEDILDSLVRSFNGQERDLKLMDYYQKWPTSPHWKEIKKVVKCRNDWKGLRALVIVLAIRELLANASVDNEEQINDLAQRLHPLLDFKFPPFKVEYTGEADILASQILHYLIPDLKQMEEAKVRAFMRVMSCHGHSRCLDGLSTYIKGIVQTNLPHLFRPLMQEILFSDGRLHGWPARFLLNNMQTEELAKAFIEECQAITRAFVISNQEELEEQLKQCLAVYPYPTKVCVSYLRFLAGGIQLPQGSLEKITVSEEVCRQVFDSKNLNFDDFKQPIPFSEFFMNL